ncbi:MAG: Nucleotidyltransferase domain protein [Spirochaetes bacterium ADurb.Bin218]|jgi:predicted nucleotidyltransferase|nr:nucleotidyltransferase domain-containing protein [Spirochaetota bacterium]OQA94595.1 MAG: Nucleotidyltransferase domain protein [Spirochaetes bacterium ADurb.Bin218]HOQ11311.1 nucleotidyltransferase domain-containing protein [Spirochaetota bacterium]HOV07632.1 nucleotidyltransferase domain-containing protein [Spirochaetota bacterium]
MSDGKFGLSEKLLKSMEDIFKLKPQVERVLIYGSRAKGNYSKGSDIDITIVAPEMNFSEYLRLYSMLEDLEIPYRLDVTKYEMLEDNIKEHIKRVGQEIYNRERS